ncbi:hypothetical protein [Phenylobacterium sp.]|jgi:dienelactone hydrolase|uniref:dienelactone hydrolase family protein n=1 Tax=Phenylobacterium sp. TaxID=1871053 RepID=UPI002F3EB5BC
MLAALAAAISIGAAAPPPPPPPRPLWDQLESGRYAVGFTSTYVFDKSREWRVTRPFGKPFTPDTAGRPIRIDIWYPALVRPGAKPMRFGDYLKVSGGPAFADYDRQVHGRDELLAELAVAPDSAAQLQRLLQTPVPAYAHASPAKTKFPLVFWIGGQNDDLQSGSVMAEFLASRGYVVAEVALQGRVASQPTLRRRAPDIETTVRDYEFAWSVLRRDPRVDPARLSLIGYSLGGIEAVLFADRNQDASAVIALDGTYGFQGAGDVLTSFYDYDPSRMRAAMFDLRKAAGEQDTVLDLSPLAAMRYADRYQVTVTRMHHSDFTSFATIAPKFGIGSEPDATDVARGWSRATGAVGFQAVNRIVVAFLDLQFKPSPEARPRFEAAVQRAPGGKLEIEPAAEAPPSPTDYVTLIRAKGFDATVALVARLRAAAPADAVVVDWAPLNNLAYDLLAQKDFTAAIAIFRLAAAAFPTYADAADSLGDGYRVTGDKARAKAAYEHAVALVASDARYKSESDKKTFVKDEESKIKAL